MRAARVPRSIVVAVTIEDTATGFLRGYLANLRALGFHVTVTAASVGGLEAFARTEGVDAVDIPMARRPSPIADLRSLRGLVRVLRQLRPEILMTATPKASLLGMLAGALTGVPVRIYQLWGLRSESAAGAQRTALEAMERLTMLLATRVVANSPSLAAAAQRLAGERRVEVVGEGSSHGVDLARFSRSADMPALPQYAAAQLAGAPFVVGFAGRICRDKGVVVLAEAMRLVAAQRPAMLLALGAGEDEEAESALRSLADVVPVLRVPEVADPRPWFCAMDVHVLPSLREGFPNAVLEAAALEVPTVTTSATGARDSVVDGRTGVLVPAGDPAELARAILALAADPDRAASLAAAARRRVEAAFEQRHVWALQAHMIEHARGSVLTA